MNTNQLQQRVLIQVLSEQGMTDRQIARRLEISRYTVRKWRRQAERGESVLSSRMGRPRQGELSTYPQAIVDQLRRWRKAHPGWGAKTLVAELKTSSAFAGQRLPAESGIARWLKQENLSRPYEKHQVSLLGLQCTSGPRP
ncbi:MAG: helix-turn-helix domain-containing protein [Acidobacteriota bacterium]